MDMAEMMKSPHHIVMMAYQQNAASFAKVLWDLSSDGKIQDVDSARNAFAELKRSAEKWTKFINDFGITTPKAIARSFKNYATKRPNLLFHIEKYSQIDGTIDNGFNIFGDTFIDFNRFRTQDSDLDTA